MSDLLEDYLEFGLQQRREAGASNATTALIRADDPELKSHMAKISLEGSQALMKLILARQSEINHPDPEFAASFVIDQINAMLYALFDPYQKHSALVDVDDNTFKKEIIAGAAKILALHDK